MEDLITLVIAIAIGLASMLAGQKNKNKNKSKNTRTGTSTDTGTNTGESWSSGSVGADVSYSNGGDSVPSELLERELSGSAETSGKSTQPSALDILGRILSGDLSDLVGQPKPQPKAVDAEYVDPMTARRKRQVEQQAERKRQNELEELRNKQQDVALSPIAASLRDPVALRQAIVVNEVLNKPLALRRQKRAG